ncbi:MAG: hypothetical protein CMM01_08575 [Rhodopirellula sp.]|nr:hypothetical protein [Rhodopirellula sp.]
MPYHTSSKFNYLTQKTVTDSQAQARNRQPENSVMISRTVVSISHGELSEPTPLQSFGLASAKQEHPTWATTR